MDYDGINPQIEYFILRHCTSNWIIEDAITNFIDLTYVFKGRAFYTINGTKYEVNQGDLICIPQGSRRSAITDAADPMISYASNFQLYDTKGIDVDLPFPLISFIGNQEEFLSLYNELTIEWLKKNPGYGLKARALLLMILQYYFKQLYYKDINATLDSRIKKAVKYIIGNLHNQIEVDELASVSGLSTAYFGTLFKKSMGTSAKEYINKMKINNAENILLSGEFSVHEAANKCGFEDIFYFSKIFKKIKGYSPSKILVKRKN